MERAGRAGTSSSWGGWILSVNPPGEACEACTHLTGDRLRQAGWEIEHVAADDRPEHSSRYPCVNVVGTSSIWHISQTSGATSTTSLTRQESSRSRSST